VNVFRRESGPDDGRNNERRRGGGPRGEGPRRPPVSVPPNRPFRQLAFWALLILVSLVGYRLYQGSFMSPQRVPVDYTRFLSEVERGNIANLKFIEKNRTILGELRAETALRVNGQDVSFKSFKTSYLGDGYELSEMIRAKNPGAAITVEGVGGEWVGLLFTWLPLLLVFAFWFFVIRQMQSGSSAALKFGKTKARVTVEGAPKVTFKDVAGCDEAKQELQEIIEFLKEPQKFQRLGGRIPKGALLLGPPGSGKTLLAKAVAGEAGVPFFSMSGSDFVEMFVGVGASVTGDTPVLVRVGGETRLVPIGEFVDGYYADDESDRVVPVSGVETLGFRERESKFQGSPKRFMQGSRWSNVHGVYRHHVTEIVEIHYLGGVLRTTADHSVFVRSREGVQPVAARDLEPGDVLVNIPYRVRGAFQPGRGTRHESRAHEFEPLATPARLRIVEPDPATEAAWTFALEQRETMSQAAIGAAIGVSQATVGNWQSGRHEPRSLSSRRASTAIPEDVELTPSLMKLFGYFAAEGRENGDLEFCFGAHETDLHADVAHLLNERFGVIAKVEPTADNSVRLIVHSAPLGRFFARHCGNGSHNKHVPSILWDLPREYFEAYLTGYALGDGYVTKEGKLSITSVSRQHIRELTWLCAMHGIKAGVREMRLPGGRSLKGRALPESRAWNLIIGKTSHWMVRDRDHQQKRPVVRRIEVHPYDGYVYDLCGCEGEAFFGGEQPLLLHNSRVRDLFEQGKRNAPCIVFIDEIDAVGRHRGAGLGGGHDEREQTLNQLLVEMDGFDSNEGVIIVAATNRPDVLDPALLRPGRFDRQIVVDWPDVRGREGILRVHSRKIPLAEDVDLKLIARGTPGMSGADLANLVNEAALLAARRNHKKVSLRDFEDAKDRVMLGLERKSLVMTEDERRSTAYHEAGHALVAWLLPGSDPVNKITIIPRGRALGVTSYLPQEERYSRSKEDLLRTLCMMMGGRAAEYLIFNHLTTGAANDLERATSLARKMVCELGMSDNLGPLTFGRKEEMVFLGREIASHKDYSEETAIAIDKEVRSFTEGAYNRALGLLRDNLDKLHLLANTLLEREVMDGEEMNRILRGEKLEPLKPAIIESETAEAAADNQAARTGDGKQLDAFVPPAPRPAGA
jgi:ATP-dependent metalloprotease FtsH